MTHIVARFLGTTPVKEVSLKQETNIFNYRDYRVFLKDSIALRRRKNQAFGVRQLAMQAGFKSPGALSMVVNEKRHLSIEAGERVAKALKLQGKEKNYFTDLVRENICSTPRERSQLQERLLKIKNRANETSLQWKQYCFLSRWYYLAIYEMVSAQEFQESPAWIAQRLRASVPANEIQRTLEDLNVLGLIQKVNGKWAQTEKALRTEDDVKEMAVRQYHESMIEQARNALELPLEEREFGGLTVKVSKKDLAQVKRRIREFKNELNEALSQSSGEGEVYQLNLQFFPLTKSEKKNA